MKLTIEQEEIFIGNECHYMDIEITFNKDKELERATILKCDNDCPLSEGDEVTTYLTSDYKEELNDHINSDIEHRENLKFDI